MTNGSLKDNSQSKNLLKYRFPLWLTIFFFLLILVPIFIFSDLLFLAKISGVFCLILVIVALRIWLRISKANSNKVERFVLNNNQIFDLERKYTFLKSLTNSDRQILFHRTGLLMAELDFISEEELNLSEKIEFAFNFSILFFDVEYRSLRGLKIEISKNEPSNDVSLSSFNEIREKKLAFWDYKSELLNSGIFRKIILKLSDFEINID